MPGQSQQRAAGRIGWAPLLSLSIAAVSGCWVVGGLSSFPRWHGFPNTASTTLCILAAVAATRATAPPRYQWSIVVGLAFSAAGDAFLMKSGNYFVPGLFSFLVAHLFYLWALTSDTRLTENKLPFLVCGLFAAGLLVWLWPGVTKPLRLPVVLYAAALLGMAAQATNRALSRRNAGAILGAIGGVFFVASDSVLAYQRFHHRFEWGHFIVLSTYFTAQCGIALSVLLYAEKRLAGSASRCEEDKRVRKPGK